MEYKDNNKHVNVPDISDFLIPNGEASPKMIPPEQIGQEDAKMLSEAGILIGSDNRSATMVVRDHHPICLQNDSRDFEMMPISAALKHYDWLREKYYFKAVPADYDEAVASCATQKKPIGFFIHVKRGAKVTLPCQAAMYMAGENVAQMVHNIVILDEDSRLELITGCITRHSVNKGLHIAVGEHYIGKKRKACQHHGPFMGAGGDGVSTYRHHRRREWAIRKQLHFTPGCAADNE